MTISWIIVPVPFDVVFSTVWGVRRVWGKCKTNYRFCGAPTEWVTFADHGSLTGKMLEAGTRLARIMEGFRNGLRKGGRETLATKPFSLKGGQRFYRRVRLSGATDVCSYQRQGNQVWSGRNKWRIFESFSGGETRQKPKSVVYHQRALFGTDRTVLKVLSYSLTLYLLSYSYSWTIYRSTNSFVYLVCIIPSERAEEFYFFVLLPLDSAYIWLYFCLFALSEGAFLD